MFCPVRRVLCTHAGFLERDISVPVHRDRLKTTEEAPELTWLLLAILFDFGFVQICKFSQRRGYYAPVVVSTNYLTLCAVLAVYLLATGRFTFSAAALQTGLITGAVFIGSMSLMMRVLEIASVGAVLTAFRISIAVPVALGIWLWQEPVVSSQFGGIILAFPALLMMTSGARGSAHATGAKTFGLLFAVFFAQGLSHSCLRSVHYAGLDGEFVQILMVMGATAGTIGFTFVAGRMRRPRRAELAMGMGLGTYNALALCVIMVTLSRLPGTLFFPASGCSVILLDNLSAHFFWKERLNRVAAAGVGLAILAVALVI